MKGSVRVGEKKRTRQKVYYIIFMRSIFILLAIWDERSHTHTKQQQQHRTKAIILSASTLKNIRIRTAKIIK